MRAHTVKTQSALWRQVFSQTLTRLLAEYDAPEYVAHMAADCADAALREVQIRRKYDYEGKYRRRRYIRRAAQQEESGDEA